MNAKEINLLKYINSNMQMIVPIYQRKYSWTQEECEQLWKDIVSAALNENQTTHFLGSIVTMEEGTPVIGTPTPYLLIDGQQRLISISLLIKAYSEFIKYLYLEENLKYKRIQDYYLFNSVETGELKYKLILTKHDKEVFEGILEDRDLSFCNESSLIISNYKYFKRMIESRELDPSQLYKGLGKLTIVGISLTHKEDNPQLIFESLNSTGKELTHTDLIRNYFLMDLRKIDQDRLYTDYWFPMESFFDEYYEEFHDDKKQLDWFFRDYITYKTRLIPTQNRVYDAFKKTFKLTTPESAELLIKDIYEKAQFYNRFALLTEKDPELNLLLVDIDEQRANVTYPFFLELFEDYEKGILTKSNMVEILELISSYLFRRWIVGIPTNALNTMFSTLLKDIDKADYLNSLKAKLVLFQTYKKFPTDDEFVQMFKIKDVYNSRNIKFILEKLNNFGLPEKANIENYTIEHIMPQTLPETWKTELGSNWKEIHNLYLHTIGNLTLVGPGLNEKYSNLPFIQKRDYQPGGFVDSQVFLNRVVSKLENWNEETIKNRTNSLIEKALQIWKYPSIAPEVLAKYDKSGTNSNREPQLELEEKLEGVDQEIIKLFYALREKVLSFHPAIQESVNKTYIAYKTTTNFFEVYVLKNYVTFYVSIDKDKLIDPLNLCKERLVKYNQSYNLKIQLFSQHISQVDDVVVVLKQAFQEHMGG